MGDPTKENIVSEEAILEQIQSTSRPRGRPKGSKNKPKILVMPETPEVMQQYIPESIRKATVSALQVPSVLPPPSRPVLKDGLPNLPEGKMIGRPMGKKNSGPRKPRQTPSVSTGEAETEEAEPEEQAAASAA